MTSQYALATPLQIIDYRDSSQIVVMFTQEFGKISCLARGIKGFKKKTRIYPPEFFSFYQIRFNEGRDLSYLVESQMIESCPRLRTDLARLYSGYYYIELLRFLTEEGDPSSNLFDLFLDSCKKLEQTARIKPAIIEFEYYVLKFSGFFPHLEDCVHCGNELESIFAFTPSEGGALCKKCQRKYSSTLLMLQRKSIEAFLQLEEDVQVLNDLEVLRDIRRFLQFYWTHLLEKELKLLPYIMKMKTP